jgi:hypothetical protein
LLARAWQRRLHLSVPASPNSTGIGTIPALELLDQYPWFKLYPISIHPDFRQKVWSAVQERLHNNSETLELELKRWHDFCSPH